MLFSLHIACRGWLLWDRKYVQVDAAKGGGGCDLIKDRHACWPLSLEPSAMTSRHPHYYGHLHCRGHPPAWVGIHGGGGAAVNMQLCNYARAAGSIKKKQTAAMESFRPPKRRGQGCRGRGGGRGDFSHVKGGLILFGGPKSCGKWWKGGRGSQTSPRKPILGFFSTKRGNQIVFLGHKGPQV